jgi:hypothetical protein
VVTGRRNAISPPAQSRKRWWLFYDNTLTMLWNKKKSTSPTDIAKAKKIFFDFGTSKFQMMRESVLEEYQSYGITDEQEKEWLMELLEKELNRFDINDNNSFFPLWFIIETNCNTEYLQKLLTLIDNKFPTCTNQYYTLQLGQTIFKLLFECSKNKQALSRQLKLRCLTTVENLISQARQISMPNNFVIPDFSVIGEGLTQEQYVMRKIMELEYEIEVAKILR